VGQLDDEVEKNRELVDVHISATAPGDIARAESKLAASDGRIAGELRSYERWIDVPGERDAWDRTLADVAALEVTVQRALEHSRKNQDLEARHVMDQAGSLYALVGADFDRLIALNHRGATDSLAGFSTIRHRLVLTLLAIGLCAVAGVVILGRWALLQI